MQHIMVAHDLSEQATLALKRAAQLATQHQARLSVLYVQEEHLPQDMLEHNRTSAQEVLQGQLDALGASAEVVIARGRPAQTLIAQQKAREADLLVMGDHHQESRLYFAGTTLERVLQKSTTAVLLVVGKELAPYAQALVPMDFSACSCRALQMTSRLLPSQAKIHAVHVQEQARVHDCAADEHEWQLELFTQLLADEQAKMSAAGAPISHEVLHGELHDCLDSAIAQRQPQLLALGKHGRGEMADALLGSLARHYLQQPPCDLLLVK